MFDLARVLAAAFALIFARRASTNRILAAALATAGLLATELAAPFLFRGERYDSAVIAMGALVLGTSALPIGPIDPGSLPHVAHYLPVLFSATGTAWLTHHGARHLPELDQERRLRDRAALAMTLLAISQGLLTTASLMALRFLRED